MKKMVTMIAVSILVTVSTGTAAVWYDDFSDGVVDMTNYQINTGSGGVVTVTEDDGGSPAAPLGYAELFTNSPGGGYILNAVSVQPGDTVRTTFTQASAWNSYSVSSVGLTYDLSSGRPLDTSVACFYLQQRRDNVLAYRHVGTQEELVGLDNAGNPEGQTWVYEIALGLDNGDGTFDATLSVYDLSGNQLGQSATMTTSTPTGNMYWYAGDNRTVDYIHELEIVPEPISLSLLAIGALIGVRRRR